MTATIIVADSCDVPDLVSSASALFIEDGGRRDPFMDTTWPVHHGHGYYTELVENKEEALCLLARHGGNTTGHLVGRLRRNSELRPRAITATLESIRVDGDHRRRGIATALIEHFFGWAREKGANEAFVTAYAANSAALSTYRGRGFAAFETRLRRAL